MIDPDTTELKPVDTARLDDEDTRMDVVGIVELAAL